MPVMDGIEATEKIREFEKSNHPPRTTIVALTAADTSKSVVHDEYRSLGFDSLLGKPTSKAVFKDLIS